MTEMTKIEVVYMGKWTGSSGKMYHTFTTEAHVENGSWKSSASLFKLKMPPHCIGGLYKVNGEIDGDGKVTSLSTGGFEFVHKLDHPAVLEWEAQDALASAASRAEAVEKKAAGETRLKAIMDQLRRTYQKLPYPDHIPFKVWIMKELDK